MIRINLLANRPTAEAAAGSAGETLDDKQIRNQALLKLFIVILPAVVLFLYENQRVPELIQKKAQLSNELAELTAYNAKSETAVNEIKKFKDDETRIQNRIAALEKLQRDRTVEIKFLKLVSDVIPERAWLTKVEMKAGKARVLGFAFSNREVSTFVDKLKSNILISELALHEIKEEPSNGGDPLMKFDFTCKLESKK